MEKSIQNSEIARDPIGQGEADFDGIPRELPDFLRGLVRNPMRTLRSFPVDTQLTDSDGIFGYYPSSKRFGIRQTVDALLEAGRIWSLRHSSPRIGVGDISKDGGGDIDGHASHEKGIDVDVRPMRNDGSEGPVLYTDALYSRSLTQEFVDLISANGNLPVQVIWFNDPGVFGVAPYPNHSNHLHVRFLFPDQGPPFPFLARGSKGPAVRELQRRLNYWISASLTGYPSISVDGDFGERTFAVLSDFQSFKGIGADGKAGSQTWPLLPVSEGQM